MFYVTEEEQRLLKTDGVALVDFVASTGDVGVGFGQLEEFAKTKGIDEKDLTKLIVKLKEMYLIILWVPTDTPNISDDELRYTGTDWSRRVSPNEVKKLIDERTKIVERSE